MCLRIFTISHSGAILNNVGWSKVKPHRDIIINLGFYLCAKRETLIASTSRNTFLIHITTREHIRGTVAATSHIYIVVLNDRIAIEFILPIEQRQWLICSCISMSITDVLAQILEPTFIQNNLIIRGCKIQILQAHFITILDAGIGYSLSLCL